MGKKQIVLYNCWMIKSDVAFSPNLKIRVRSLVDFNLSNDAHLDVVENDVSRFRLLQKFEDRKSSGLKRPDHRHVRIGRFGIFDRRFGAEIGSVGYRHRRRRALLSVSLDLQNNPICDLPD